MATIEKRVRQGKTIYRVKVRYKHFPVETASFNTMKEAKAWAGTMEQLMRDGRYQKMVESRQYSFAEAVERYITSVLPTKPKLIHAQKPQLNWWKQEFDGHALGEVSASMIAYCRDKLASGKTHLGKLRSPSTVNRYIAALSHLFTIAMTEWEWINENPMAKVRKLKEPRGRIRFLSDEERATLLQACQRSKNKMLYPIVVLCLSTGARKMEIVGLKWQDVDFERKTIILHETKNGERRCLPLSKVALQVFQEYKQKHAQESDLVFPSKHDLFKPIEIRKSWLNVLKKTNIQNFRFHDLRHCAASYLAMNGASLNEIAEILGHKTLAMVKRYTHLSETHTAKIVESMNDKIFANVVELNND